MEPAPVTGKLIFRYSPGWEAVVYGFFLLTPLLPLSRLILHPGEDVAETLFFLLPASIVFACVALSRVLVYQNERLELENGVLQHIGFDGKPGTRIRLDEVKTVTREPVRNGYLHAIHDVNGRIITFSSEIQGYEKLYPVLEQAAATDKRSPENVWDALKP